MNSKYTSVYGSPTNSHWEKKDTLGLEKPTSLSVLE